MNAEWVDLGPPYWGLDKGGDLSIMKSCETKRVDSPRGFIPTPKRSLKKDNIGGRKVPIGIGIGLTKSIRTRRDRRLKLPDNSVSMKMLSCLGFINSRYQGDQSRRRGNISIGDWVATRTRCMESVGKMFLAGRVVALQRGRLFIAPWNGKPVSKKCGKGMAELANCAGVNMGWTITTNFTFTT